MMALMVVMSAMTAKAQTADQVEKQITVGDVIMTVNPQKGGKILSLKYKEQSSSS